MLPNKRNNLGRPGISTSPKSKRQRQQPAPVTEIFVIPDHLRDYVQVSKYGKSAFVLRFPIDDLDAVHRLAWGLDYHADSMIVNLEFLHGENKSSGHARFCVHSSTDRETRSHQYNSTIQDAEQCIQTPCSPRSTILTCALARELFGLLGLRGCRDLGIIYDRACKLIKSDPTQRCLICGHEYSVKVYTPTACLGKCLETLDKWPLRARLSHLLSDTKVLDFMLCCIYTAVDGQEEFPDRYETQSSLLVGCPIRLKEIRSTIDSLPKISDELGMRQLVDSKAKRGSFRRQLLSWLTLRFRGCIVSLTQNADFFMQGEGLEDSQQFVLLNSRLERQQNFANEVAKIGVGSVAFHGARAPRAFNIITDALRNMSSEPYLRTDNGIFYSDKPGYSYAYTRPDVPLRAWKKSQFSGRGWSVLFGLEVALAQIPFEFNEHSTDRESTLMIRYIFLLPSLSASHPVDSDDGFPLLQIDQDAMKKVYEVLDQSALSSRHIGLDGK